MSKDDFGIIMAELKSAIKKRGLTYKQLASKAKMSEAGIKRILSSKDTKFSTLQKLCDALDLSLFDIAESAAVSKRSISYLSPAQEDDFVKNFDCYKFFNALAVAGETPEEIARKHRLTKPTLDKYLAKLAQMKLIRLSDPKAPTLLLEAPIGIKNVKLRGLLQSSLVASLYSRFRSDERERVQLTTREWRLGEETWQNFCGELEGLIKDYDALMARDQRILTREQLKNFSFSIMASGDLDIYGIIGD